MNETTGTRGPDYKVTIGLFLSTAAALSPFTVHHAMQGAWATAVGLSLLIGLLVAGSIRVWRNRPTLHVSLALASATTAMTLWALAGIGPVIIHWTYGLVLLYFYLLPIRIALLSTAVGLPFAVLLVAPQVPAYELSRIIAGLTLVTFFAYVFSHNVARQRQQLLAMANTDSLTLIGNRRAMAAALEEVTHRLKRFAVPSSLIVIDLDHFKEVNDRHGHSIGDRVLVEVVARLRGRIRLTDALFRYGGEEFVVLAGHSDLAAARVLANALLQEVSQRPIDVLGRHTTISAGVAELRPDESWEAWLRRGDKAQYLAKDGGRNRVVACTADSPEPPRQQ
jgi:diguanylate cyclase